MAKKIFSQLVLLILLLCPLGQAFCAVGPEGGNGRVVRVGRIDIDNFFSCESSAGPGFGIDYLNEIAKFTGWSYEYVPGSWNESVERLRDGEIDLLFPASKSEERAGLFLFSKEECGMDFSALYTTVDNMSLGYEDYASFSGMRVGMITGNQLNSSFENMLRKEGISVHRVFFGEVDQMKAALREKRIDAMVYGVMNDDHSQKLLAKFDYMPLYFMTSKRNAALMEELDAALHALYLRNPYFPGKLYERYYLDLDRQAVGYTLKEKELIRESGPLFVACDADGYPFEWKDPASGRFKGIYPDILRRIEAYSGLTFQFRSGEKEGAWKRLKERKEDLLASAVDTPALRAGHNMVCTDAYFTAFYTLIGRRGSSFDPALNNVVAIQQDQTGSRHQLALAYPNWKILPVPSVEDCLRAVADGKADIACVNSITLQADPNLSLGDRLTTILTSSLKVPVRIGIAREREDLLPVLNKAILKLTKRDVEQAVLANTLESRRGISLFSFVSHFPATSFSIALLILFLVFSFVFVVYRDRLQRRQNSILEENYERLRELTREKEELQTKSDTDMLTGLYHKAAFRRRAKSLMLQPGSSYWLIFLDMDNFKSLNDQYGHVAGDEALVALAEVLKKHFRGHDLVGRFGGDEFFVFIERIPEQTLRRKLSEIGADMAFYYEKQAMDPGVFTLSIGVAASCGNGFGFDDLLRKADSALYKAKADGRNRIEFFETPDEETNSGQDALHTTP